jgi:hypothetical protein
MIEWCNPTSTARGTGDKAKTDLPRFASPKNTRLVTQVSSAERLFSFKRLLSLVQKRP